MTITEKRPPKIVYRLYAIAKTYSMMINVNKTNKTKVRKDWGVISIFVDRQKVELVSTWATGSQRMEELRQKLKHEIKALSKRKRLLTSAISTLVKKKIVKRGIRSAVRHCAETKSFRN